MLQQAHHAYTPLAPPDMTNFQEDTARGPLSPQLSQSQQTLSKALIGSWCWKAVEVSVLTRNRKAVLCTLLLHYSSGSWRTRALLSKLFLCFTRYLSQNLAQTNLPWCLWVCFTSKTKLSFINSANIHCREEADPLDSKASLSVRRCMNARSRKQVNGSPRGHLYLLELGADPKPVTWS